jgi:hypothetical protein
MKNRLVITLALCFVLSVLVAEGQKFRSNSDITGVCYAGKNIRRTYVPPPDQFLKKSGNKGGGSITVYYSGFTQQGINAFEFAVSIVESMLPPDTKMTMRAVFEQVTDQNVLGSSVITGYVAGWGIDAAIPVAYYPVSLAEKIAGVSLNEDAGGDLELRINSSTSWYFGTDGSTPVTKYDLVTVVIHEICHGLGFFNSMNTEGNIGYYGAGSIPMVYETFIENGTGKRLTDTLVFPNYSASLGAQLTSRELYFNGPLISNFFKSKVKLYAPSVFDKGSSISHLDEATYQKNDPKSLMTPYIDLGEAIHNPGDFTFSILGDLGWINTRIIHKPSRDTEKNLSQIIISAQIKSDTLYNKDNVGVVYSFNNFHSSDTLFMTSSSNGMFNVPVPIPSYNSDLQYYIFTEDCFRRIYRSPSLNEYIRYETYIGRDTVRPVISHVPLNYCLETVDTILFNAFATDNLGVDSVYLEYKVNDGQSKFIGLNAGKDKVYKAFLRARNISINGGDTVKYRIFAVDSAITANISVLPKTGYFDFPVEDISSVVESYSTDFSHDSTDFFNIGFNISRPANFSKYGLHTKHPYESPEVDNANFEYTAMLRHPVRFRESGLYINYNEVVLVEPGEQGSVFGSPNFFDYVIMEASKDFGKNWIGLDAGYDSRYDLSWETAYNNSVSGMNSTYIGMESMLLKHTIFYKPSDKISAGDTLLIRFRLFSDPYANGWGWVIQDLKLNALIDASEKREVPKLSAYPNPGNGVINLYAPATLSGNKTFSYSVYNSSGVSIVKHRQSDGSGQIDISSCPSGVYIIVIHLDNQIKTFRYNLIK